jgi:putative membrane protein
LHASATVNNLAGADKMTHVAKRCLVGAIAGLAATVPMTAFMVAAHRLLPRGRRRELPPARITGNALRQAGIYGPAEPAGAAATLVNHLAYGAAVGALYRGAVATHREPSLASGVAWGLGIWAGSYLGWLPYVGWHRSAVDEPLDRNALMIAAHVVWGASCAAGVRAIERPILKIPATLEDESMDTASDRFTIIRQANGGEPETIAIGLTREQAR